MSAIRTAVILAGGLGTRLRSEVPDLPKPMAPINQRPFLEYQMDYWIDQGIQQFVLSVGYRHEAIVDYFGQRYRDCTIQYAVEESPLGTGGGLLLALDMIAADQPVLAMNGDTFFEVDLAKLAHFHSSKQSAWTFSLFSSRDTQRYLGMDIDANGEIRALKASSNDQQVILCNGGVYLIEPDHVKQCGVTVGKKVSLEDDLLSVLMSRQTPLFGCHFDGRFIDIGVPDDYRRAADILA